jgi:hypothetical protein
VRLNLTLLLGAAVWKFAPTIVTAVPGLETVGVKLVIMGPPEPTTKDLLLDAEPEGVVMEIGPVVAPEGTDVTSSVDDADETVASTPLN